MTEEEIDAMMTKAKDQFRKENRYLEGTEHSTLYWKTSLNTPLEVEMEDHLAKQGQWGKDRRNGKMKRRFKASTVPLTLKRPVTGTDHLN